MTVPFDPVTGEVLELDTAQVRAVAAEYVSVLDAIRDGEAPNGHTGCVGGSLFERVVGYRHRGAAGAKCGKNPCAGVGSDCDLHAYLLEKCSGKWAGLSRVMSPLFGW